MSSMVPPQYGVAFTFGISLVDQSNTKLFKSSATIAVGDFKLSKDFGALANLTNLPSVAPASSKIVQISLTATEMQADNVTLVCSDASGSEWADLVINIMTSVRRIDDLAYPATSGRSTAIDASGQVTVGTLASGVITATSIAADAITAAKVADGTIDAATFAAGAINAAAIATDAITAAKIAADAIGASELAADAVTEIQSGLSTLTAAGVRTAVGLASANLDTQLDALPTNAELATALGTADDATLAAIAGISAGGATAAQVWAYASRTLTQTAAQVTAAVSGSDLAIVIATTFTATLTGLTISALWTKCFFTIKPASRLARTDSDAQVQILVSNPGVAGDGLLYLGAAVATANQASLVVSQVAGTVAITITDNATAQMTDGGYTYDLKILLSDGSSVLLTSATVLVDRTPTTTIT